MLNLEDDSNDGEKAYWWLIQLELYIESIGMCEEERPSKAAKALRGDLLTGGQHGNNTT